jgi:hypothetical protein
MAPRLFAANTLSTNHGWFSVSMATRSPAVTPRSASAAASCSERRDNCAQVVVSPRYRSAGLSGRIIAWVAAWDIQWCRKDQAGAVSVGMGDSSGAYGGVSIGGRRGIVPFNVVVREAS